MSCTSCKHFINKIAEKDEIIRELREHSSANMDYLLFSAAVNVIVILCLCIIGVL